MNIRLVAYRKATSAATSDTAYNLDLQEAPNVSLNFQFSDIKKPESRKGSYSQTFKLPFTDNNNEFFQNWYGVNLSTLVYSTRKSFDAIIYVGTVPQFEGQLQLKSVYKKAEFYEVVLMSNTATLFSSIGEKKLKDVFKEDNNTYNEDLNHQLIYTSSTDNTFYNSWIATLVNTAGDLIKDTSLSPDISKIVYPLSVTQENFYYDDAYDYYLKMSQTAADNLISDYDIETAATKAVNFTQFRPSIQIKELFKLIIARAGFSYTSTFIDGDYFGNIFMTLGGHLEASSLPTTNTNVNPSGFFEVGNLDQWGVVPTADIPEPDISGDLLYVDELIPASLNTPNTNCTIPNDPDSSWNTTYHYFTKKEFTQQQAKIRFLPELLNVKSDAFNNSGFNTMDFVLVARPYDVASNTTDFNTVIDSTYFGLMLVTQPTFTQYIDGIVEKVLSLSSMEVNESCRFYIITNLMQNNLFPTEAPVFKLGGFINSFGNFVGCGTMFSSIRVDWQGFSVNNAYTGEVDIPACIDPDIKQKDFLKIYYNDLIWLYLQVQKMIII